MYSCRSTQRGPEPNVVPILLSPGFLDWLFAQNRQPVGQVRETNIIPLQPIPTPTHLSEPVGKKFLRLPPSIEPPLPNRFTPSGEG
jgi:hypothetical protein